MYKNLVLILSLICSSFTLDLPSNLQICKRDNKINECLKVAIQDALPKFENGLPDFNIGELQPIEVSAITISSGKSAVNLEQKYKNVKIYNLLMAQLDKVEASFTDSSSKIVIEGIIPEVRLESDYDFNGQVMLLPIVGSGYSLNIFKDVKFRLELLSDVFKKKDEDYAEVKKTTFTTFPGKIIFRFDNLFNGDKKLSDELHKVLNENWKEIWADVGGGYENALALIIQNVANQIVKKVPRNQMFPL